MLLSAKRVQRGNETPVAERAQRDAGNILIYVGAAAFCIAPPSGSFITATETMRSPVGLALLGGTAVKRPPTPHRPENIGGTGWEPCGDHPADDRVAQAEEPAEPLPEIGPGVWFAHLAGSHGRTTNTVFPGRRGAGGGP